MASLATIRTAIADTLTQVDGLRVHSHPASIYTRPVAMVGWPDAWETADTFNRTIRVRIPVRVEIDAPHDRGGDVELGRYIDADGAFSLEQVIDDDPTLGGVVDSAALVEWRNLGPASVDDSLIYTATAIVEVLA
jgi:hypothetical protein